LPGWLVARVGGASYPLMTPVLAGGGFHLIRREWSCASNNARSVGGAAGGASDVLHLNTALFGPVPGGTAGLPCLDRVYGSNSKKQRTPERHAIGHTHARFKLQASRCGNTVQNNPVQKRAPYSEEVSTYNAYSVAGCRLAPVALGLGLGLGLGFKPESYDLIALLEPTN
jgi:hypothetical protein